MMAPISAPRPRKSLGSPIQIRVVTLAVLTLLTATPPPLPAQEVSDPPTVVLVGLPFRLTVDGGTVMARYAVTTATGRPLADGTVGAYETATTADLVVSAGSELPLTVRIGPTTHEVAPTAIPPWYSLLPPIVAVVLALVFREVVTALFAGVWLGALAVAGFNPLAATFRLIDRFLVTALADVEHTQIVLFSLLLGGMVGVISRNGGTLGVVEAVTPHASTPRRGKLATWFAGLCIFFDDYANTLIVGNAMRPITDRLRISREKLAYLVDSTAAPVAALVPISTWVGYEISLIEQGLGIAAEQVGVGGASLLEVNPFLVFVQSIPYLFYPILALLFVFLTSSMGRDFGPMATAERRAAEGRGLFRPGATLATDTTGESMEAKPGVSRRAHNALVPVFAVIAVVLGGLYGTGVASAGQDASLMDVFGAADPFVPLLWGSLTGCLVAVALSVGQRTLTLQESIEAGIGGVRAMIVAMVILVFAWSLGDVTETLGTAQYLSLLVSERLPIELIPVIVFATSAATAFATGTSWGTMAIMLPVVIPLTVALGGPETHPGGAEYGILLGATASVLAGAIFGDHCSPISDTTVLSSTASACDHVDHVRTQLPYALTVGIVGMLLGNVGAAYGLPPWLGLTLGAGVLYAGLRAFGRSLNDTAAPDGG